MTVKAQLAGLLGGAALRVWMLLVWGLLDMSLHTVTQKVQTSPSVRFHEDYPCNETIVAPAHATGVMRFPSLPSSIPIYCHVLIGTWDTGYRIRLTFNGTIRHANHSVTCDEEYVHVGNSRYAVDIKSMTSYKFCENEVPQEVVSRGRKLWVVYSARGGIGVFSGMAIKYEILPYVSCNTNVNNTYFRCSPVECIPYDLLCDGHAHCSNGRDEYCDRVMTPGDPWSSSSPLSSFHTDTAAPALWALPASLTIVTCFLCEDGTCIRPTLPVYHFNRGQPWWWLCDQFPHCRDGTDERMDVCMTMKSKSSALYDCPLGLSHSWGVRGRQKEWGRNVSAVLWRRLTCDTIPHCHGGEDETDALCTPHTRSSRLLGARIYVPVGAVIVFVITLTLVYNRDKCSRVLRPRHGGEKRPRRPGDKRDRGHRSVVTLETGSDQRAARGRPHVMGGATSTTVGEKTSRAKASVTRTSKLEQHPNYFILSQTAV